MAEKKKLVIDFRDVLAIFFRIFIVVVIIQSFIQKDRSFVIILIWSLGLLNMVLDPDFWKKFKK
jgi:hypothetical protein